MFCPMCGTKLVKNYPDIPWGVTATIYEAVCQKCDIAYQVVMDDQLSEYMDIHGEPWEPEEKGE